MSGESGRPRDGALLAGLTLAALGALWLVAGALSFPGSDGWGYDYRAYADAAARFAEGGSLYQAGTLEGPYRPGPYGLYLYAPPLGIAITPLAVLGQDAATTAWYLLHAAALALACLLMPVPPAVRLAAFGVAALSFGVTRDLVLGNVSVLLLLPLAAAWRWLDRPAGSIAQALAMAVRPMLGMLLVWGALRRRWHAVAWTLAAGLVLIALTLPIAGIGSYLDYLTVLRNMRDVTGVPFNHDLGSVVLELGGGGGIAALALFAGYANAIAAMLLSLRRDREVGYMVVVTGSLLLSPLLWDHYLAMLVLPAAFLAARGRTWAIALPLLSWLPAVAFPLVVLAAAWLPFLAHDAVPGTTDPLPAPAA